MSRRAATHLARYIVQLYPRSWRARYASEALDLLEQRAPTLADLADLAYHVLYTWRHPDLMADGRGSVAQGRVGEAGESSVPSGTPPRHTRPTSPAVVE
jgi:hypothetical protein